MTARHVGVLLAVIAACGERPQGQATSAVITLGVLGAVPLQQQEPSAAVSPDRIVVAYDDEDGVTTMGWAFSNDGGVTWTKCTSVSCPVNTAAIIGFRAFARHSSLASEGPTNRMVYVTLADTDGNPATAELVVAALSTDGGATFPTAVPINADSCNGGTQDMPHAAFDYTTSPATLWIVWRHNGAGNFGPCIRRFFIDTSGGPPVLTALGPAFVVTGAETRRTLSSQGGYKVQAGDGLVTVVYANDDNLHRCPSQGKVHVDWGSTSSFDNGETWSQGGHIFETKDFLSCLGKKFLKPAIDNSIRAFDFVRSPTGQYYVAIHTEERVIRLFMSAAAGILSGATALLGNTLTLPWFEWCPGTPTDLNLPPLLRSGVTWNWRSVMEDEPCRPSFVATDADGFVLFPALAVDGFGRLGISYYDSRLATLKFRYQGNVQPQRPGIPFQTVLNGIAGTFAPPAPLSTVPPASASFTVEQPLGSYVCMITERGGAPLGDQFRPGCTSKHDFFPFWVTSTPVTFQPQIATRRVVLTP